MLKHLYLILIATFIFGFVSGFILWLFNNTVDVQEPIFEPTEQGLVITVLAYGGCESVGCASYRIAPDGSYVFIERQGNAPEVRSEGELGNSEYRTLRRLVEDIDLRQLSRTVFTGTCPIAFDGLGFRYTIGHEGEFYRLDSCVQDLRGVPLFENLNRYFGIFQDSRSRE